MQKIWNSITLSNSFWGFPYNLWQRWPRVHFILLLDCQRWLRSEDLCFLSVWGPSWCLFKYDLSPLPVLRSSSPPARVAQTHPSVSKSLFHVGWPLNLCFSRMHSWWIPSIYLPIHLLSLWLHLAWFYPVYWLFLLQWSSFLSPGFWFSSVQSLNYVYLWPHGLQHARLPCPSPTPRACSNSYLSSQFFASGGQRTGVSESINISPSNEYSGLIYFRIDWFDLLAVQGTLRVFSNTIVQKHQFFGAQLSLWSNSHIHT